MLEIVHPGLLASVQDLGRAGYAHLGIGRAGAADAPALRLANALVGNKAHACGIEMTLQGATFKVLADVELAITGAPLPQACIEGMPLPMWTRVTARKGAMITLGGMPLGCRSYLAMSGGVEVEPRLGSRSVDINAGVGPLEGRALHSGERLRPGRASAGEKSGLLKWSLDPAWWFDDASPVPLRLLPGSHTAFLTPASRQALAERVFTVATDSNRVGVRLKGQSLQLEQRIEMVSEGSVAGTVQLPPGGEPIILGCEHPVTGGYPRIAQLAAVDLPRLAQCRPGARVRFQWVGHEEALAELAEHERRLRCLEADIERRLRESR